MDSDETKFQLKQYDMTCDERDRYQDFENEPDDQWVQELREDDPHRFVTQRNKSNAVLYKNDLNCEPLSYGEDSVTRQKTFETETETEFIAKFKKLKKIIYNTMIVMNLAKEPGEASL